MNFDFEKIQKRYKDFWNRENATPILLLKGSKGEAKLPQLPASIKDEWCNIEYVVQKERALFENTAFIGDALPLVNPNLGPDIFGATLGTDIIFEKTTSYSVPFIDDISRPLQFKEDNKWWKLICDITQAFCEDSRGDYLVGVTDLHPGVDGLVSIRSPQELCYDMVDCPEDVLNASMSVLPFFKAQFEKLYAITQQNQTGTSNWMGIYNENPWYVTSADFICMISEKDFENYVIKEIIEEAKYLQGNTIFHLDGPGALRHLDRLLEVDEISGIQWVYGAGQPTAKHWLNVLKKIQNAGKNINIELQREDFDTIFSELKPEGLSCSFGFDYTESEALEMYNYIQKKYT